MTTSSNFSRCNKSSPSTNVSLVPFRAVEASWLTISASFTQCTDKKKNNKIKGLKHILPVQPLWEGKGTAIRLELVDWFVLVD